MTTASPGGYYCKGFFGLIPIKLDLFHAVQRIASKIKKRHPLRRKCLDSFRLVFRQSGDIEKERKQPTPSRQVMQENLARFRENWTNVELSGDKVLSDKAHKELDKLKVHIEKGCLENIPTKAGTSRQESMHKSLRKSVEKRRVGVKVAVASIGTCLYRWNERRLSDKIGSSTVPPVTHYLDSIDIHEAQEVFGTGELQTKCSEEELEDSPEPGPCFESDSNSSSSEDESNENDGNAFEKISEEDAYQRVLDYALYMKSLAQSLQAKCQAPTMQVNLSQFTGRSLVLFSSHVRDTRPDAED